jgi:uncharacterized protein YjbI with pentapeptide repeats
MADEAKSEQPDDREPTPERQAELRAAYEANAKAGRAPYASVHVRSRGELQWIAQERHWRAYPSAIEEDANQSTSMRSRIDGAGLRGVYLANVNLSGASLMVCDFSNANLLHTNLSGADLFGTNLSGATLDGANLHGAKLMSTDLRSTQLVNADLTNAGFFLASLSGANLIGANLVGASLVRARLDGDTDLTDAHMDAHTSLADVKWGSVSLSRVRWADANTLGDEDAARQPNYPNGRQKDNATRLADYQNAVVAYRQVSTVLRSLGLNEHADRYAYRAQLVQRQVLWRQAFLRQEGRRIGLLQRFRKLAAYLGSGLLDLIAGYGYQPLRSLATYIATIAFFAILYWSVTNDVSLTHGLFTQVIIWLGMTPPPPTSQHLQGYEAVVVSMTSFHGRGFFQPTQSPGDKVAILAAIEAAIGLLLEITFIATFTQRFFAR